MKKENGAKIASAGRTVPVLEEELQVGKRTVETRATRVEVHVRQVEELIEEPLVKEILEVRHVPINRFVQRPAETQTPVDQPVSGIPADAFKERSFEVRETAEEPVISKQARMKEEVAVGTEASERTEVVRDTLRRTDVEVEKLDEGYGRQVADMGDDEFIAHFNATYGQSGERFEETYRSAYHFAESESSQPQLRDREWLDVEDDIHRDWE